MHLLSLVNMYLGEYTYFFLWFQERPYLGLVSEADYTPIYILLCPAWLVFRPLMGGGGVFYKVHSPTHWPFGEIIEAYALLLRVPTRCRCVQMFWRCSEVVWGTTDTSLTNYLEGSFQSRAYFVGFLSCFRVVVFIWPRLQLLFHCIIWASVFFSSMWLALGLVASLPSLGKFSHWFHVFLIHWGKIPR